MNRTPKMLLVGTGAVGGFYGGKLSQGGAHVSTLCRSDYETVKKSGIKIKSIHGDFNFYPETVINNISEYEGYPDYLIIATKVLPEINVVEIIKKKVGPDTSIVLIQNGIEIENPIAEAFPNNEIISGLAFICVSRTNHGEIDHQDYGRLVIGKHPEGNSKKVKTLCEIFLKSGINCSIDDDIITARWKKLIWNAPFNPISVIGGRIDTKKILDSKPAAKMVENIMNEVVDLASCAGHQIPREFIQKNLEDTYNMTPYKTSMLLDYENNRQMEVEAILGNTTRLAQKHGINIPYTESLYALLKLINDNM